MIVPVLFRWMHILSAVIAVGGLLFTRLVLMPAAQAALNDDEHSRLREKVIGRWKFAVMFCILFLLISGFYNLMTIGIPKGRVVPTYHMIFGIKFLLAMVVFFFASALTGRAKGLQGIRDKAMFWTGLTAILATIVVLLSGILSNIG